MIGKTVSKYEIESKIGQGGMGVVYKARDLTLPRHVAIKLLAPFMSAEGDARDRFEREADATAALNHPNIADIYETGETDDGQLFIVMPLYEGRTLQDLIDEGPIELDRALDLFTQLATGLAKAHEKGIVHRDIKPDNVFVTEDGFVKILDFGLARFAGSTRVTRSGFAVGTVQYMSPEQARGDEVGPASDVFSMGVILHQLMSGELPFNAEHNQAVLYKIMNEDPPPLGRSGVPDYVLRVIDGALQKDSADRFVDAADLLAVLKGGAPRPRPASRPRWLVPAAIALVAALAVVYVIFRGPGAGGPDDQAEAGLDEVTPGALVVFPFTVRGSEEAGYLSEGMVDLVNVGLNDVAGIYPVDPRAVHQALQRDEGGSEDDSMRRVTRSLGASMYIDGNVIEAGGRYQANASLYDAAGEVMVVATARVDTEAELFDLAEELARQVIVAYAGADAAGPRRLETSLAALKPFLQAEQLKRSGNFVDAADLYREALAADSLFALGWMRYSLMLGYTADLESQREAAARAIALGDQLSESEMLKIRAVYHSAVGELEETMRAIRSLMKTHPHDPEAWYLYGDAIFHSWPLRGGDGAESYNAFVRAEKNGMPRNDYGFLFHLRAAATWGDLSEYNRILDELIVLEPHGDFANWVHAEIGAWRDDPDEWARGIAGLTGDPNWLVLACASSFATYQQVLDPAREVALLLTDSGRAPTMRAQGHLTAAFLNAARGRLRAAGEQMQLAMASDPIYAAEYAALLALMPLPDEKQRQQAALTTVLRANTDNYQSDESLDPWSDTHAGFHDVVLGTARAALYLRLDRAEEAEAETDALESYKGDANVVESAHGLAEGLRAELALTRGDTALAIQLLEDTWITGRWESAYMSGYFSRARERLVIARVYAALDDVENALRWYNTAGRMSAYDTIFMPTSYLECAMLLERHGRIEEAASYYTRFIELWDGCDEALAPQVADARQRLSQLQSR